MSVYSYLLLDEFCIFTGEDIFNPFCLATCRRYTFFIVTGSDLSLLLFLLQFH